MTYQEASLKWEGLPSFYLYAAWNEAVTAGAPAAILGQAINKIEGPWVKNTIEPPYHLWTLFMCETNFYLFQPLIFFLILVICRQIRSCIKNAFKHHLNWLTHFSVHRPLVFPLTLSRGAAYSRKPSWPSKGRSDAPAQASIAPGTASHHGTVIDQTCSHFTPITRFLKEH